MSYFEDHHDTKKAAPGGISMSSRTVSCSRCGSRYHDAAAEHCVCIDSLNSRLAGTERRAKWAEEEAKLRRVLKHVWAYLCQTELGDPDGPCHASIKIIAQGMGWQLSNTTKEDNK